MTRRLGELVLLLVLLTLGATAKGQPAPQPSSPLPAPLGSAAAPGPLHIHVRGTAELQATASAEPVPGGRGDDFSLRGELIDDAGSPIPRATIHVTAFAADDPRTPIRVGALTPC